MHTCFYENDVTCTYQMCFMKKLYGKVGLLLLLLFFFCVCVFLFFFGGGGVQKTVKKAQAAVCFCGIYLNMLNLKKK